MERVSKFSKTSATDLKCILENVSPAIKSTFEHCRTSKTFYGSLLEDVSEELTNLFRKAKTILNLFLATLDGVIVFDTDTESETDLLIKVIDSIGLFVNIANELDLRAFVETAKMFGKLAIKHQQTVQQIDVTIVTGHVAQLTKSISLMLLFYQDTSAQIDEKKIRVVGFSLKILDKLLTAYCSYINNEILECVIDLLLKIFRCSPLCLQKDQFDDKLIEVINVHISKGADAFLNTTFKSSDFKQAFFEYGTRENIDKLGYHLSIVSIMNKLLGMSHEQSCTWTLGDQSIIDLAFTNINYIQEEICVGEARLPGVHDIGERQRSASLYEATLVSICGLISQIPAEGFYAIELILLKHLLGSQLWSSLLSADTWCFVARIGSSELCASHVKYLLKVHAALMKRRNSLEMIILENLIGRLYSLLSEDTRHDLMIEIDDLENPSWTEVARFLPPKTKSVLQTRLASVLNEIPSTFIELQRQPTVQNWNRFTLLMILMGKLNYLGEKNIADMLSQIWNSVANTIEVFENRQLDILSEFMLKLFSVTQPEKIQKNTLSSILEAILASLLCCPPHVKVMASHYLRNNVKSFDNCEVRTANALAELNCCLLEDENPWVRQEALESFVYVTHMCPNDDLVTRIVSAITRKSSLSDSLPAYLSDRTYYELRDFADVRSYLRHVVVHSRDIRHVCDNYEAFERNEKLAKLENRHVDNSDESPLMTKELDECVNKLCGELSEITKKSDAIGKDVLRKLRLVCEKFLDITTPK
ncbi:uncharacterized protein C1orf112 homolog isoform X2 [Ceratina calcarata]|nr:uncharacterized protein C1orf112 homolog isoform X2 [Ceratina calcarata]